MVKNITFAVDEALIRKAREKALKNNTTLNNEFRLWIATYVGQKQNRKTFVDIMKKLDYTRLKRKPTRDHMNGR